MHQEAKKFLSFVKTILPTYFINKKVLDVGSDNIDNNNYLFEDCDYYGNYMEKTKDLPYENIFDTIISSNYFEHDPDYHETLKKIYKMLKPNGLFCFTCASNGRLDYLEKKDNNLIKYYYKNLTELDLKKALKVKELFSSYDSYYNSSSKDLYFWGIKREITIEPQYPIYKEEFVLQTTNVLKL